MSGANWGGEFILSLRWAAGVVTETSISLIAGVPCFAYFLQLGTDAGGKHFLPSPVGTAFQRQLAFGGEWDEITGSLHFFESAAAFEFGQ